LNVRGQVVLSDLPQGNYGITLLHPEEKNRRIKPPPRPIPDWMKVAAAAVLLIACVLGWGGVELYKVHLQKVKDLRDKAERAQQETETAQQEAETAQQKYDKAWAKLRFEELAKPIIRVLPAEAGGKPNHVRVELSPRIEEGLVRDVSVCWGDSGDIWEPIYEAEGTIQSLQAAHQYTLPAEGQTSTWVLQVYFMVPDEVAAARRLPPDQLTYRCSVEATTDGVRLLPGVDAKGPAPQIAVPERPEINWLNPRTGEQVGWKTSVSLKSPTATEKVTVLVRSGVTFYVQSGARPLAADIAESFVVQLGAGRKQEVGTEFDILAVCSDTFLPPQSVLDMRDVPSSAVVGRVTVTKAAGAIRLGVGEITDEQPVSIEGEVWTPNGAALLVREEREFEVLEVIEPSPTGSSFTKEISVPASKRDAIYLLVYKSDGIALQLGQTISEIPSDSYWLYGPAKARKGFE
jgi:hypothetical protein